MNEQAQQLAATALAEPLARGNRAETAPVPSSAVPAPVVVPHRRETTSLPTQLLDTAASRTTGTEADLPHGVDEHFAGTVEKVEQDAIQVRMISSGGERATAWIPLANVPESEHRHISIGAPLRIAILSIVRGGTVRREHRVRFLRTVTMPKSTHDAAADWFTKRMQRVLGHDE